MARYGTVVKGSASLQQECPAAHPRKAGRTPEPLNFAPRSSPQPLIGSCISRQAPATSPKLRVLAGHVSQLVAAVAIVTASFVGSSLDCLFLATGRAPRGSPPAVRRAPCGNPPECPRTQCRSAAQNMASPLAVNACNVTASLFRSSAAISMSRKPRGRCGEFPVGQSVEVCFPCLVLICAAEWPW